MWGVRRLTGSARILALGVFLAERVRGREAGVRSRRPRRRRVGTAGAGKVLNLFIWSDYLAPNTLSDFEKQTGITVHAAYYDSNETLETKLLAGSSGYDVVVPTASYFERQIKAGVYLTLDKSKLPNLKNMDPQLMARVAMHDPDNAHGVIYMWGTNGIGYNEKMVKALMPDAPLDSWRLVFDPAVASKIAKCGISVLDSPAEMMRAVLNYLGKDPNSQKPEDVAGRRGDAPQDPALHPQHQLLRVHRGARQRRSVRRGGLQRRRAAGSRPRARCEQGHRHQVRGAEGGLDPLVRHARHPEGCAAS